MKPLDLDTLTPWDCTASASLKTNFWPCFYFFSPNYSHPYHNLAQISNSNPTRSYFPLKFWELCIKEEFSSSNICLFAGEGDNHDHLTSFHFFGPPCIFQGWIFLGWIFFRGEHFQGEYVSFTQFIFTFFAFLKKCTKID